MSRESEVHPLGRSVDDPPARTPHPNSATATATATAAPRRRSDALPSSSAAGAGAGAACLISLFNKDPKGDGNKATPTSPLPQSRAEEVDSGRGGAIGYDVEATAADDVVKETTALLPQVDWHGAAPVAVTWEDGVVPPKTGSDRECCPEILRKICRSSAVRYLRRCYSFLFANGPPSLPSLLIGSITSVLYHCVFSLAMASSITRRHAPDPTVSLLGPMAKTTALGVISASIPLIFALGPDAPALYPSADLFLAPFFSEMGRIVDEVLYEKRMRGGDVAVAEDDTALFLGTFAALVGLGMLLSSALCILAAKVKLANLGAFLPHAVICGFFSSIGVMVWTLAFGVDNNGAKVTDVLFGAEGSPTLWMSLVHHAPSFAAGVAMKVLCPRNAMYLPLSIGFVLAAAYAIMFFTGTTLDEAQEDGWFWTMDELVGGRLHGSVGYGAGPPAPFGIISALLRDNVDFDAVRAGVPTAVAMSLIYALRCSLHAVALRQLSTLLLKKFTAGATAAAAVDAATGNGGGEKKLATRMSPPPSARRPTFHGSVNMSFMDMSFDNSSHGAGSLHGDDGVNMSLDNLRTLLWYGIGHLSSALVGGFSGLPAFAVGSVLCELGVKGLSPQYGGIAILVYCYMTDFSIVSYIPKAVFSSLLVLCFLDFIWKWFVLSFYKTKNIWEWLVVPAIVVIALVVPLLEAVVLGVAASTFIFVGAFYSSGVVKFASTGLSLRSTIDRMDDDAAVLDSKGDLIQILVLQNYIFFGNASSCLQYIQTMFEEPPVEFLLDFELPPVPKYIILDFSLVTGMDTSAVDILSEIAALCKEEKCALLLSGLSKEKKSVLSCGGVKPLPNDLLFCYDLDSAMGKAEDGLLNEDRRARRRIQTAIAPLPRSGFLQALVKVETHLGISCMEELKDIERYATSLTVLPSQYLFGSGLNPTVGVVPESKRGLCFIEKGTLKIERDPRLNTLTRAGLTKGRKNALTLGHMNARSASTGRLSALLKSNKQPSRPFRLAKVGPGWVIGAVEGCSGLRNPGAYVAVTECRVYLIPYSELGRIERDDPMLALNLFKLLSHIVSRRQISAIEQLGNLHSIITSPPVTQPRSRVNMGAINSAMQFGGGV